jgi:hydroxyacylglutathione hydrolase
MPTILTFPLGFTETNCYLVADDAGRAVVIDPGYEPQTILVEAQRRAWTVEKVLLTHAHFDHIGAVGEVVAATGAALALHPLELPLYRAGGGAALFGLPVGAYPEPDLLLTPGETVTAGALRFEVLFVPGHTAGHVAFYLPAAEAVFSGDVLFYDGIGRTDLPGGHYATLLHSITRVLGPLPPATTVYSGHGPATTLGRELRENPFLAE